MPESRDPLTDQIPAPELRDLYVHATLRQRYSVAKQHLEQPEAEPNQVVTAVAALEGFARAVAVKARKDRGEDVGVAYRELKHAGPVNLLRDHVAPTLANGISELGADQDWLLLRRAVDFRNLLVHEATFLQGGSARRLAACAEGFFERLAVAVGVVAPPSPAAAGRSSRFIGIDLAWQSDRNPSAVVIAEGGSSLSVLQISQPLFGLQAIISYIGPFLSADTVIAIDAPLIINNREGQRPCEREITRRFGRFHAGAHPSNLTLYPDPASVRLAAALVDHGFTMDVQPEEARLRSGRWFLEVYPHPAHVVLFGLEQIVKYKKGSVADRRSGQGQFAGYLHDKLSWGEPRLLIEGDVEELLTVNPETLRGRDLKAREDRLDALLCCYIAAHYWYWGADRNELIGSLTDGNIVVPTTRLAG